MTFNTLSLALLFIGVLFWAISWRITGRLWFPKAKGTYGTLFPSGIFSQIFADVSRAHGVIYILLGIAVLLAPRLFAAFS